MPIDFELNNAVFTKTAVGQQEIQTRALGLTPMVRRVLILVDGHRRGKDLAAFATGAEIAPILEQLLKAGCVEAQEVARAPVTAASAAPAPAPVQGAAASGAQPTAAVAGAVVSDEYLSSLPDASMRSAADGEMARNFMINTVNTVFGQNMRLTLVQTIFEAKGTEELRRAYLMWAESMSNSRIGEKRLPELRAKLAKVL